MRPAAERRGPRDDAGSAVADAPDALPVGWHPLTRWLPDLVALLAAGTLAFTTLDAATATLATAWALAVIVVVRSDLDRFIVPDAASAAIAGLGLLVVAMSPVRDGGIGPALADALGNGAIAFAIFWLVARLYRWRRGHDGLGFGDVKLAGSCGLWLTLAQQAATLEVACLAAIAAVLLLSRGAMRRGMAVPFGAFLAPAAWLVFVIGPRVMAMLAGWSS